MSGLTFTLKAEPAERLDLSGLVPSKLAGLGARGIERLAIGTTRHPLHVGDVFAVTGDDAADIRFDGGSERFDRLGEALDGGAILVEGDAGIHVGRRMADGLLEIRGSVGAFAGSGLRGGVLSISGDAGDDLGGPGFGEAAGLAGGTIRVSGSAGARAGDRMRRGTILITGDCGPNAGCRMIAGSLLCKGRAGRGAGALMKRGTLVFTGGAEPLGPTFLDNGPQDFIVLRLLTRAFPDIFDGRPMRRLAGDTAVSSMGEVFVPA
ncbi:MULTISPECIES: formylmethanofuran dehydrogenase subunit C [unclassified Aureimonas]|uniref:formylmethanofuran dehydrogenase subunit C n=1 Tax=unclassified Aureimonas TaxID=2615206 RepID=UPI0006F415D6|nr:MULTISPECIES: formylmethanofuran dehydrogenase subunit C [unclassified Aureimonas]KQT69984.1 formylmethanofuran dehydrogenase subunit C [Aureimonas sp. Leaf427]KQT75860.1 formylmethanofuran dehydrogenase subunit C [Aureimonas sp. Leaf460]